MTNTPTKRSFPSPLPVLLRPWDEILLVQVGVGGTGSWLAPHAARLVRVLKEQGKKARLLLIDPDIVEAKNISRQNFCDADLSAETPLHKASSLAFRLSLSLGVEVSALCQPFDPDLLEGYPHWVYRRRQTELLTIVVSCLDNAEGRKEVFRILEANRSYEAPSFWVLDCGNFPATEGDECGQVYLGSAASANDLKHAFSISKQCIALPSPALQAPDLLLPRPEELAQTPRSCADISLANEQGLTINPMMAAIAANYLFALLVTHDLRTMGTAVNLTRGKMDSDYITPASIARVVGKDPATFFSPKH